MARTDTRAKLSEVEMPQWYPDGKKNPHGEALTPEGQHNILYYLWELARCTSYDNECLARGILWSTQAAAKSRMIREEMKSKGLDPSVVGTNNHSALIINKPEEFFELTESQIKDMREQAERLMKGSASMLKAMTGDGELSSSQKKRLKRTIEILDTLGRMNEFCRERTPSAKTLRVVAGESAYRKYYLPNKDDPNWWLVFGWTRRLRIMLWGVRFNLKGWSPVPEMTKHILYATIRAGYARWHGSRGVLVAMPPRHGKTEWLYVGCIDDYADNANANQAFIHYAADEAEKRSERVRNMLSRDNPEGRRILALFPHLRVKPRGEDKNNPTRFTLDRDSSSTDPSMQGRGITSSAEGATLHVIRFDDIVHRKERDEEATRNRTWSALTGTWMNRLTGDDQWFEIGCTFWHHADAYARLIKNNRETNGVRDIEIVIMPCGDLHSGGKDPLRPLWPKMRNRDWLRQNRMQDPTLYACTHLLDPQPDELKIVKKLCYALHNPNENEEDAQFVSESECVLSIDPTGTVKKGSDRAGIVYALVNAFRPEIRILDAQQVPLNQRDLVEHVKAFAEMNAVHEIIVETVSGYHATADWLEVELPNIPIRRMLSTSTDKGSRLKACAVHLENGRVTFRGALREDGTVGPLDEHNWLYRQILDFGVCPDDHAVDGVTQLLRQYSAMLRDAESRPVAEELPKHRFGEDQRVADFIRGMARRNRMKESPIEAEFSCISDDWEPSWN